MMDLTGKAIVREWTKEEKKKMADSVGEVHGLLKEKLGGDEIMEAFVIASIDKELRERIGIEQIISKPKEGRYENFDTIKKIMGTITGMRKSGSNLCIFEDVASVWMQYFMGKSLSMKTGIIVADEDYERLIQVIGRDTGDKIIRVKSTEHPGEDIMPAIEEFTKWVKGQ